MHTQQSLREAERYLSPLFPVPVRLPPLTAPAAGAGEEEREPPDKAGALKEAFYVIGDILADMLTHIDEVDRRLAALEASIKRVAEEAERR